MAKKPPGLHQRGQIWWIDKVICGRRLRESTGSNRLEEAEHYLAHRIEQIRQSTIYGVIPARRFEEAAAKYLLEHQDKRSIGRDIQALAIAMPHVGHLLLSQVHMGTLQPMIEARLQAGRSQGTINRDLAAIRRILNLAARLWRDENGLPWLSTPPLIQLRRYEARKPYPLTLEEQQRLLSALPKHLAQMALFKVNTGTREQEVVNLRWDWEVMGQRAFLIPAIFVKNKRDRLVVCNSIAWSIVSSLRGTHPDRVFTYKGRPVGKMYNSAWKRARNAVGLPEVRVHDLKHTFGFRLRTAGVSFEDRQDLLGHKNQRITDHYSAPDLVRLLEAAEKVVGIGREPALRLVRRGESHKTPTDHGTTHLRKDASA